MIKADLQKAYDTVEWVFIEQILKLMGFPAVMVGWIMGCITTVSYSILINGEYIDRFQAKRGLRQGDPMSPYLFVLAMEYLNRCLLRLADNLDFNYHPRCHKLGITHLCFADDLLMFARGDNLSVQLIHDAFSSFSEASGLKTNLNKSQIYFGGVDEDVKHEIMQLVEYQEGTLPVKYLGVPLTSKKVACAQYQPF